MQNNIVALTITTKSERFDEYNQALKIHLTQKELHEISEVGFTYHFRTSWSDKFETDDQS